MIRRAVRSLVYNFRGGGLRQVCDKAVARLNQWVSSEEMWYICRLDLSNTDNHGLENLTHSSLALDEMSRFGYFKALAFPEAMEARLDGGCTCHGFLVDGVLAHVVWTEPGRLEIVSGVSLEVPDGSGIFDGYTVPEFRGRGIYTATLRHLAGWLSGRGDSSVVCAVNPGHRVSIAGLERAGFVRVGALRRVIRLGKEVVEVEGDGLVRLGP